MAASAASARPEVARGGHGDLERGSGDLKRGGGEVRRGGEVAAGVRGPASGAGRFGASPSASAGGGSAAGARVALGGGGGAGRWCRERSG